jgi:hypothetical protein
MTTTQPVATARTTELRALRGNCMGAAVLLVIQFGLGTAVNLYVTLPKHKSFWSTVFSQGAVAVHAIVALLLLGASVSALVRSIRSVRSEGRLLVAFTAVGLLAILVAAAGGVAFVRNGSAGASLSMALAAAVALFCYLAAIFSLGAAGLSGHAARADRAAPTDREPADRAAADNQDRG